MLLDMFIIKLPLPLVVEAHRRQARGYCAARGPALEGRVAMLGALYEVFRSKRTASAVLLLPECTCKCAQTPCASRRWKGGGHAPFFVRNRHCTQLYTVGLRPKTKQEAKQNVEEWLIGILLVLLADTPRWKKGRQKSEHQQMPQGRHTESVSRADRAPTSAGTAEPEGIMRI